MRLMSDFSASRAFSRSARSWPWRARVSRSSSLTDRTPRAERPSSSLARIASHWPWAQLSSSARSVRLAVSSWHSAPSWSTRWWRCCSTSRARAHSASISAAISMVAPSVWMRRPAAASASAISTAEASRSGSACPAVPASATTTRGHSPAPGSPSDISGAGALAGPAGAASGSSSSGAGSVSTPVSGRSSAQLAASWLRRCCRRLASLRLPASTRCRLSFLRAAVQCRPPRSTPRTSFSISVASAAPSFDGAGSPASRA